MSFRQSILYLLGVSLLVTVVVGGIGSYYIMRNACSISAQYDDTVKAAVYVEEMQVNFWRAHALMLQMALDKDQELIERNYERVMRVRASNAKILELYNQVKSDPEKSRLLANFEAVREKYLEVFWRAIELDRTTTTDQGVNLFNRFNNEELLPVFYECLAALDALNEHILAAAEQKNAEALASSYNAIMSMLVIIVAAMVILLVLGYFFSSTIVGMARRFTGIAKSIAQGDFSHSFDADTLARKDEFGAMARALSCMQRNLQDYIEQITQASEYKSAFLARMSHEIRTPINAIIGMTYIAKKARDKNGVNESLARIGASSAHLLGIINDILDMSKIEAGKFELVEEDFGMEKLLMNVCTVASVKTDEKDQQLLVNIASDIRSRFIGDGMRLSQVLTNILNNASKFTPVKGRISLGVAVVEKEGLSSRVQFCIEDNGIGLTEEQLGRLFTPFEQADGSTSRQFGGTGLGLAICDKIARMMDGNIKVESEFGKGSRFIITVKLQNSQQSEDSRLSLTTDARATQMLVIDESPEQREFFSALFSELHIPFATAENLVGGLQILQNSAESAPVSIIFLDWKTAGEDGANFARRAKAEYGVKTVVVLASMSKFNEVEEWSASAGADRFLSKPIFASALINLVNEVLGAPQPTQKALSASQPNFGGKRALLVEDVEINREIVFAYLENTGLEIDIAQNGVEALEKYLAAEGRYDVVLMDIHMPLMDGYTAAQRIREEEKSRGWARRPIVAMTANVFKEDIERCLAAGMDDHLAKPMSVDSIIDMLKKYLKDKPVL